MAAPMKFFVCHQAKLRMRTFLATKYLVPYVNNTCLRLQRRHFAVNSSGLTKTTQEDGIRTIKLSNPKKRNALSLAMLNAVTADLSRDVDNDDLRVIIIASEGPVYSAGHDLKELTTETGRAYHAEVFDKCSEMMMLIEDLPVPVIAQVQGLATAAGCQLVASCDVAVAADTARFATPGISVGLFCSTPAVALGRAIPKKIAMQMLFTAEPIAAEEALRHGLISKIVPEASLEEETLDLARKMCQYSRSVLSLGKACFISQMKKDRNAAYREAGDVMVNNLSLVDGQEGIDAFIKKRSPVWKHDYVKAHD